MKAVVAQDLGCLGSAKFFYNFSEPVAMAIVSAFPDCHVAKKAFSTFSPIAKDLVTIRKPAEFRADLVIGGTRSVVYFEGSAREPPIKLISRFENCLRQAGCTTIRHVSPLRPNCRDCPQTHLKCHPDVAR